MNKDMDGSLIKVVIILLSTAITANALCGSRYCYRCCGDRCCHDYTTRSAPSWLFNKYAKTTTSTTSSWFDRSTTYSYYDYEYRHHTTYVGSIIGGVVAPLFAICVIVCLVYLRINRRNRRSAFLGGVLSPTRNTTIVTTNSTAAPAINPYNAGYNQPCRTVYDPLPHEQPPPYSQIPQSQPPRPPTTQQHPQAMSQHSHLNHPNMRPGPSTVQQQSLSAMQQQGPSAMQQQGPSTMQQQGPSTMQQQGPSTMQQKGPSTMQQQGPSAMQQQGPSAMQQQGPSTMQQGLQQQRQPVQSQTQCHGNGMQTYPPAQQSLILSQQYI